MRKRRFVLLVLVLITTFGCSKKYKTALTEFEYQKAVASTSPVPESTLLVSGEKITVEDVVESPTQSSQGRPLVGLLSPVARNNDPSTFKEVACPRIENIVDERVSMILLYQKAKKEASDKIDELLEKSALQQWREFVISHNGDEAQADEVLRKQGMTRKQFLDSRKRMILSQVHISSTVPHDRPISSREIRTYYKKMIDQFVIQPKIQFRLIDIQPEKMQISNSVELPAEQAKKLAQKVLQQLHNGADFSEMVSKYSNGILKQRAGQWPEVNPESLAAPYNVLAKASENMKVGDISKPVVTSGHVFIFKLEARQDRAYQPLSEVQAVIEEKIRSDRYSEALAQLNKEIAERSAVGQTQGFVQRCADEIYSRSNAN